MPAHERGHVGVDGAGVDHAGVRSQHGVQALAGQTKECLGSLARGELVQQVLDAPLDGMPFLEEQAFDLRAEPPVCRDDDGRQNEREEKLCRRRVDPDEWRRRGRDARNDRERSGQEKDRQYGVRGSHAHDPIDVEEVEAHDGDQDAGGQRTGASHSRSSVRIWGKVGSDPIRSWRSDRATAGT